MKEEAAFVDAFRDNVGTGVLGRMQDILQQQGHAVSAISIDELGVILNGNANFGRPVDVIPRWGVTEFYNRIGSPSDSLPDSTLMNDFIQLNSAVEPNSGKYADLWSQAFVDAVDKSTSLRASIESITLDHESLFTGYLGERFEMVARLIKARDQRVVARDAFYVSYGGFDTHSNQVDNIGERFTEMNNALHAFKTEMADMMDQITIVVTSEFARVSLTSYAFSLVRSRFLSPLRFCLYTDFVTQHWCGY